MPENWWDTATAFLTVCTKRIIEGEKKYGPVRDDPRTRAQEAIEETYDIYNYCNDILLAKHPELKNNPARLEALRCNFKTYIALRRLEKVELELTRKKGGDA
jgi:hypothetical protein